ncbi:MAG: LytR/AlgR family response regulator transcription factor [Bacteroidia bacterium]
MNLDHLKHKITVAIIDDSAFSVKIISELVRQLGDNVTVAFIATDAQDAIKQLATKEVDLVFLDIEMPEYNGFEILEKVEEYSFKVVFTTAHENYAVKAFKINAFDYLMKPVQPQELKKVVQRYIERNDRKVISPKDTVNNEVKAGENVIEANGNLIIDTHGKTYFLNISKILYLKAERVYSNFCYEGKNILVSKSTNYFEGILDKMNFFRIHRSYIINLNHVKDVVKKENSSYFVRMDNNDELSLSRQNKDEFFEKMKKKQS